MHRAESHAPRKGLLALWLTLVATMAIHASFQECDSLSRWCAQMFLASLSVYSARAIFQVA